MRRCLRDFKLGRLDTISACDRQTDGRTDTQRQHIPRDHGSRSEKKQEALLPQTDRATRYVTQHRQL